MIKRGIRFLFYRLNDFSSKAKTFIQLFLLLPDFYQVYLEDAKRKENFRSKHLVDKLKKISLWHSNFQELTDFWKENPEFNKIFAQASKVKGNWPLRCFMLFQFLNQVGKLAGEVAEIGVYGGRSGKVLALAAQKFSKRIFLFDTFEGMPQTDPEKDNYYQKGTFGDTSFQLVKNFFSDCKNVSIYQGVFPETAIPIAKKKFCFVHVDVDIYRSVKDCCNFFHPRLVKGGVIIFDDPGFADCQGAKLAMDEFFQDKKEAPIYLATGQALIIKK